MNDKKFHLTIIDNETGATLTNADVKAVMGAFTTGKGETESFCCARCNDFDLVGVIVGCEKIVEETEKGKPQLGFLKMLARDSEMKPMDDDIGGKPKINRAAQKDEIQKLFDDFADEFKKRFGGG